jgi:hypothetical protein
VSAVAAGVLTALLFLGFGACAPAHDITLHVAGHFPANSKTLTIQLADLPDGFSRGYTVTYVDLLVGSSGNLGLDDTPIATMTATDAGYTRTLYLPIAMEGVHLANYPAVKRTFLYSGPAMIRAERSSKLTFEFQTDATANANDLYYDLTVVANP